MQECGQRDGLLQFLELVMRLLHESGREARRKRRPDPEQANGQVVERAATVRLRHLAAAEGLDCGQIVEVDPVHRYSPVGCYSSGVLVMSVAPLHPYQPNESPRPDTDCLRSALVRTR